MTDPDDLEAILEIESLTNPQLRDEVGDIRLVPLGDRVGGPGTSIIMAALPKQAKDQQSMHTPMG